MFMANKEVIDWYTIDPAKQDFYMYIMQTAFTFSVYLFISCKGVRMFVSELTNAFQKMTQPSSCRVPSCGDVAASYGFGSPNAVLSGFAFGLVVTDYHCTVVFKSNPDYHWFRSCLL